MNKLRILTTGFFALAALAVFGDGDVWSFTGNTTAGTDDLTAAKWTNDGGTTKEAPQAGRS